MRRGFTLIEFLIATALAGVIAAAITATVVRQQRFYAAAQEKLELRNRLHETSSILSTDLKSAAISEMGVPLMSDSAIEVFASIATSVACTLAGNVIGLPPQVLSRGNTLTSVVALPDTGDIALIYGIPYDFPDSASWSQYRIASVTSRSASATCPASSGFTTNADVAPGVIALQATLASLPAQNVRAGSPIHFVRRGRYSFYKSSDGWYLGYRRCNALGPSSCGSIQPVSGPFLPYSSGKSGLTLSYFNSAGAAISSAQSASLARIDVVIRSNVPRFSGLTRAAPATPESLKLSISPRNRAR